MSIAIMLPSVNFSSTQQLSKLYSQDIRRFIGFTSKIVLFRSKVSVGFSVISLSLGNSRSTSRYIADSNGDSSPLRPPESPRQRRCAAAILYNFSLPRKPRKLQSCRENSAGGLAWSQGKARAGECAHSGTWRHVRLKRRHALDDGRSRIARYGIPHPGSLMVAEAVPNFV